MRPAVLLAVATALVAAACGGSGGEGDTASTPATSTTDVPATTPSTTTTPATTRETVTTTTTMPPFDNLVTAEALVVAMYDGDTTAIESLPWFNARGVSPRDATEVALFGEAVNVEVLDRSCELEGDRLVACRVQARDDLLTALGGGVAVEVFSISFNEVGELTGLERETRDGGLVEAFGSWAWGIAYPDICQSPAQCGEALLGVVDEYNETYPGAVVASYIAAYNAADLDRVMIHFTDESIITGHPFDASLTGLSEIREVQMAGIAAAASLNPYTISNLQADGDTVTWDHVWVDDAGQEFCISGNLAVIDGGKIVSWVWPDEGFACP